MSQTWKSTVVKHNNSTPGYVSEKNKSLIKNEKCTPMFMGALFIIVMIWKQPKCLSKKVWCDFIYIYDEILLSHGKEWNFAIDSNMDGFGRHYAKWNKSDKRHIRYDMWNLKKNMHPTRE